MAVFSAEIKYIIIFTDHKKVHFEEIYFEFAGKKSKKVNIKNDTIKEFKSLANIFKKVSCVVPVGLNLRQHTQTTNTFWKRNSIVSKNLKL